MVIGSSTGPIIRAAKLWVSLLFCLTMSTTVFAESSVQGSIINTPAKIKHSTNIATGSENKARQFSIALKNTKMSGTVINSGHSKNTVNIAAGKKNVANQGSISISRGSVKGSVVNNTTAKSTSNMAVGSRNQANQSAIIMKNSNMRGKLINSSSGNSKTNIAVGNNNSSDQESIRIESSRIRGTVMNRSTMQKSSNIATGNRNSAAQATIVMGGVQLRGTIVNNATGRNATNTAAGYKNEANQSSIIVDGSQATTMTHDSFQAGSDNTLQTGNLLPIARIRSKEPKTALHVTGQIIFLIDNNKAGLVSLDRVARKYRLKIGEETVLKSLNRIMVVSSVARDAEEIAEALNNESGVYNPQPNYVFATMGRKDPLSPMQNLVSLLDLEEVHRKVSGKNITVAIIDTGVEIEHQDLRSRIIGHQNFISDSTYQGEIHGTAVAGIIGAGINEYGIVGIAPNVSLLALRACRQISKKSPIGECFSTSLARSLDAAITAKVDLVNLSLGAQVNDILLGMMIDSGHEKGIVFTAPVGNDPAAENIAFPASHDRVISVAGLDEQSNPLPNKQLASMADAVAPATHLFVTTPGNSYNFIDGTSLASGSIAGIIALSMEKSNKQNSLSCLPRFNGTIPWPKQVFSCIGL